MSDAQPNVGDVITFSIEVTNEGPNDATGIAVTDQVPSGYTNITNVSNGGDIILPVGLTDGVISWADIDLAAGASIVLTFDVEVLAPVAGAEFLNIAEVVALDQEDIDSEEGNGADTDGDGLIGSEDDNPNDTGIDPDDEDDADDEPVEPQVVDISLIKLVSDAEPLVGDVITFTIEVSNDGNNTATGVTVEDAVPNGYANIANISNGGSAAGSTITWTGLTVEVGTPVTLTFDVEVLAPTAGVEYNNIAEVTTTDQFDEDSEPGNGADTDGDGLIGSEDDNPNDPGVDPDDEDDADDEPVIPNVEYDLAIEKALAPGQAETVSAADPSVDYVITVTNQGNVPSLTYSVEDVIPAGTEFVSASNGGTFAGGLITWTDLPNLDPGATQDLTVTLNVVDFEQRAYRNHVEISDDSADTYVDADGNPEQDIDSAPGNFDGNDDGPGVDEPTIDEDDDDFVATKSSSSSSIVGSSTPGPSSLPSKLPGALSISCSGLPSASTYVSAESSLISTWFL